MNFTDQLNRSIFLPKPPERIISLVPSQTELLADLGVGDKLVGVTKFCVHPTHFRKTKTIVGGTKNYRMEVIDSLKPDLIIGNKEENDQEGIEILAQKYPVWMSDISNLEEAFKMISSLGELTNSQTQACQLVGELKEKFSIPIPNKGTSVYLIWENPMMAVGKNTFINEMLTHAGFENLILESRYPELKEEYLKKLNPDFLLLSSEPFPFKEVHIAKYQALLPETRIEIVNGELFSWYGSRLKKSPDYFLKF
ncbi:ABC-type Fe3+-hydroxamate transport system substrate-binding protein [Algoriphagus boseongensis]|uniref:ABC-type Fe3+-hydroxamate transport system substrate-binding protein n=1 Tax=Algoriphagus boseongensis TaxID=1442587 RepID=A0A4R6T5I7_9BACT|nr:helical backbone metal receptor [Algoriphagus boseongensis]TDQ14800.1 ABC-type Fe3+-hydroxamate transport system substrate-binding protein [Algoriphagus boseongensis]